MKPILMGEAIKLARESRDEGYAAGFADAIKQLRRLAEDTGNDLWSAAADALERAAKEGR